MENNKNREKIVVKILSVLVALFFLCIAFFAGFYTQKLVRRKELSSLEWALSVIEKHYYFDYDGDEGAASLKGLVSGLDSYSQYYTAEEYTQLLDENNGSKSGVGIYYSFIEGVGAAIIYVIGNSPASRAGIESGDVIVYAESESAAIDLTEATSSDASQFFTERQTGEEITLTLSDGSQATLAKTEYTASYAAMRSNDTAWDFLSDNDEKFNLVESACDSRNYLPEGFAYISLSQFFGNAVEEMSRLVSVFNDGGYDSLILDLRNNGGGYVSIMQGLSGCFVDTQSQYAVAMTAEYKDGSCENYYIHPNSECIADDVAVYVLANSSTASASEALIGVLVSYGVVEPQNIFISDFSEEYLEYYGGSVKTAQTYGKGIMQSPYINYSTGEVLTLTTAKIYWPNGNCIHGTGLTASDGCTIVPDVEWSATKGDSELKSVLDIIASRQD